MTFLAQTKANPQREHGQDNGDDNGGSKPGGVEQQLGVHDHRGHADIMHGADTCAHENAADDEVSHFQLRACEQVQRD